jgi:hypothetical protein
MRKSLLRDLHQNNAKNKALTVSRQGFIFGSQGVASL